ncbi:corticotropin-releasing factor-binding protein isoform X1 [Leptidea sinapis]|uniref:corticotropin-releasing factor-binding protein isoform X1 n=2 Tax=Leptidea sinapis TaxID=189913 RepID=UPI0021342601|nr:corticotropin-releasing factor-binding protein isoform X1 [Leptidea sinapis]
MGVLFLLALVLTCDNINGLLIPGLGYASRDASPSLSWFSRVRRLPPLSHRIIDPNEDCFMVTSEEGELFFKSPSNEPVVCGIYMIAEPDKRIQVTFNYLDVPCDNGGLVAWIDGWELSGQVWPADSWDDERVVESCDRRPQHKLVSRQNAALVQYRVPAKGKGFAVTIRHLKNSKPCNIMLFGAEGVYTLRNHGETGNCSVIAISPSVVRVLDLNVGQTVKKSGILYLETGTLHRCTKRGLADYVDIGGASGLDHTRMEVFDSMCGLDSNEARRSILIACEDTVVRLVSSGKFQNSVTLAFAPLSVENIEDADLICGFNEV